VVEVVVPHDAAIYREIVEPRDPAAAGPVETSVRPASLEEIGVGGLVSAWGEKRGDRVVAGVLVYTRE
jgi:hypothetical protein